MADLKNRQWTLAKRPVGMIKESDYRWKRRRETGESLASFRERTQFIDQLFDLAAESLAAQFLSEPPRSPFSKLQHFPDLWSAGFPIVPEGVDCFPSCLNKEKGLT
jgi:hypothetical protein